jgi:hypothetical protein
MEANMRLINKKEIESLIGKSNFIPKRLGIKMHYVAGIPEMDKIIDGRSFLNKEAFASFTLRESGVEFRFLNAFKSYFAVLPLTNIIEIAYESKEQLYKTKERSVIGRAVVGGLVLGPIGAIIGGMSGVKDKTTKQSMPDLLLTFIYNDNSGTKQALVISTEYKQQQIVEFFLKKNLGQYFTT